MVMFDAAVVVDMQDQYLERLVKRNAHSKQEHDRYWQQVGQLIHNQNTIINTAADHNLPVLSITYALAGNTHKRTADALQAANAQYLAKDACDVNTRKPYTNHYWKKHLADYLEAHKAQRIFLMGLTLDQCVAEAATAMHNHDYSVLSAKDVVDDPEYFPHSKRPAGLENTITYLNSHTEAL